MQIARFALSMIKSSEWHIGGSDEISSRTQVEKFWRLTLWKLQLPEVYYTALCTKNKWRVSKRYKWGREIFSERGVAVQPTGSVSSITCARPLPTLPTFNPPMLRFPATAPYDCVTSQSHGATSHVAWSQPHPSRPQCIHHKPHSSHCCQRRC